MTCTTEESRSLGLHSAGGGRRPVKVWNATRTIRKAFVVGTYDEFVRKGREKLGFTSLETIRVVLETDGTQVDDGEYFQTLSENSIFLFLRAEEIWCPAGTDAIRSVLEAIPSIVCETLYNMGLQNQTPSWKIMDNKGRITVILYWERGNNLRTLDTNLISNCSTIATGGPKYLGHTSRSHSIRSNSSTPILSRENSKGLSRTAIQHSMLVQTSFDSHCGTMGLHHLCSKEEKKASHEPLRQITVINHEGSKGTTTINTATSNNNNHTNNNHTNNNNQFLVPSVSRGSIIRGAPSPRPLSRQGSSVESAILAPVHFHTAECSFAGKSLHRPTSHSKRGSPTSNECDFHCCSLHTLDGHSHSTDLVSQSSLPLPHSLPSQENSDARRSMTKAGAHVRFSDRETCSDFQSSGTTNSILNHSTTANSSNTLPRLITTSCTSLEDSFECTRILKTTMSTTTTTTSGNDSSESETENLEDLEETVKFLLLVDNISYEAMQSYLSVKDIGIILERLNYKIIDIEKLEREIEGNETRNWRIKATIRGKVLRELGVIYKCNYYSICEDPSYQNSSGDDEENDEPCSETLQ